jgi:hypothetical protein
MIQRWRRGEGRAREIDCEWRNVVRRNRARRDARRDNGRGGQAAERIVNIAQKQFFLACEADL